jgi:hypothetical protein
MSVPKCTESARERPGDLVGQVHSILCGSESASERLERPFRSGSGDDHNHNGYNEL